MKKIVSALWMLVIAAQSFGQQKPEGDEFKVISMEPFESSILRQMTEAGVIEALHAADSITVELVATLPSTRADQDGPLSPPIRQIGRTTVLTSAQKEALLRVFANDNRYRESPAPCLCPFDPQLRVRFSAAATDWEILVSAEMHGEIRVLSRGKMRASAQTGNFVPEFLEFLKLVYPDHEVIGRLANYHSERSKRMPVPQSDRR